MHISPSGTTQYVKHTWVAHIDNQCVGYIHLLLEPNKRIKFMDAWVHENHRRNKNFNGYTAYAWCRPMSLSLLIEKGFEEGDTCVYVEKKITE